MHAASASPPDSRAGLLFMASGRSRAVQGWLAPAGPHNKDVELDERQRELLRSVDQHGHLSPTSMNERMLLDWLVDAGLLWREEQPYNRKIGRRPPPLYT